MFVFKMEPFVKGKFWKFVEKKPLSRFSKELQVLITYTLIVSSLDQPLRCLFLKKCWVDLSMDLVTLSIKVHQFLPKISSIFKVNPLTLFNVFILKKWFKLVSLLSIQWILLLEVKKFLCFQPMVYPIMRLVLKFADKLHLLKEKMSLITLKKISPLFSVLWELTWKSLDFSELILNKTVPWKESCYSWILPMILLLNVLLHLDWP